MQLDKSNVVNSPHDANAFPPIVKLLDPVVTVVNAEHPWKAYDPTSVIEDKFIVVSAVQLLNAYCPIVVVLGRSIEAIFANKNARSPIFVTLLVPVIVANEEQSLKQSFPTNVVVGSNAIDVNKLHD